MTYLKVDKTSLVNLKYSLKREVLRTNRSGAYSCSTIIDCNTRKYHGLLICPLPEIDNNRHVLLSGLHETIVQNDQEFNLGMHKYAGDHYEPKGHKYLKDFISSPIPTLTYQVGDILLSKEKVLIENENQLLIRYTLLKTNEPIKLRLKPFLAFRNIHHLSHSNLNANTKYMPVENGIKSQLYKQYPQLYLQVNKANEFVAAPDWYYNIEYIEDQKRGYEYQEDLFTHGFFEIDMQNCESIIISASLNESSIKNLNSKFDKEIKKRIPRDNFNSCLANTVQQFFIYNGKSIDIIAGYPWLPIRNRDMLIAAPGLTLSFYDDKAFLKCLKTVEKRFNKHLLAEEAYKNQNCYPADIPLWFVWSVQQYGILYGKKSIWNKFGSKLEEILQGFLNEKEHFEVKPNGLIYIEKKYGINSWINGSFENKSIINRYGYLIELNALWYNTICFALEFKFKNKNKDLFNKLSTVKLNIEASFLDVFWDEQSLELHDFVAIDKVSTQIRPNQIFAASLPYTLLSKSIIKKIIDKIRNSLLTPYGIRSLSPIDPAYTPVYDGNHKERELAAFNGSVWPWLMAHLFDAWIKVDPKEAIRNSEIFVKNIEKDMQKGGICSISELYHGNPPHKARGAISFVINIAELIRLKNLINNAYKIY